MISFRQFFAEAVSNPFNNWKRPDFDEEMEEIKFAVEHNKLKWDENLYRQLLNKSPIVGLHSLPGWQKIQNTNPNRKSIEEIEAAYKEQGAVKGDPRSPDTIINKDIPRIVKGFKNNETMPASMVFKLPNGTLWCIGGNKRIQVASAMDIEPKVVYMDISKESQALHK